MKQVISRRFGRSKKKYPQSYRRLFPHVSEREKVFLGPMASCDLCRNCVCPLLQFCFNGRRCSWGLGWNKQKKWLKTAPKVYHTFNHSGSWHFPGAAPTCGMPIEKLDSNFAPKMSPKYRTPLTWIKNVLFLIAQAQQAAVQTAISQIPVRNFPSGSHLLQWWIVAAELWSVKSREILIFPEPHQVMPSCQSLREILMAIICCCWWPHQEMVGVCVIWVTTCYITYCSP